MNLTTGPDGYFQDIGVAEASLIAVQVQTDDSRNWKLQGTLDDTNWYDVEDENGASLRPVGTAPLTFNVRKYATVRIYVSDTGTFTANVKFMSGI